jgi:glycosyl transferase, family 25
MMDNINKVIYINLNKRKDRNVKIKNHLNEYFSNDKIMRFEAIENKHGNLGCYLSHIEVLKIIIQNNYENTLILEDDFIFNQNFEETDVIIEDFFKNYKKKYDI